MDGRGGMEVIMNRIFRLIFLAALTAIFFNVLGVESAQAMTKEEYQALPVDQRAEIRRKHCAEGETSQCEVSEIAAVQLKVVGTTGSGADIEKLEAAKAKLDVAIRKVNGGETSSAADELVVEREKLEVQIEKLKTPKVEVVELTAPPALPPALPPLAAYFPGAQHNCDKDSDCGKGACVEQVCFSGWAKSLDRTALKKAAQAVVASGLSVNPGPSIDGGRLLCSLKSLQMSCDNLTCNAQEYPAVLGTSNSFPPDLQRLIDLNRAALSCAVKKDGTCIESDWSYLANTNTMNFGHIQCLPRFTLPERPEVAQQRFNAAIAAIPPQPVASNGHEGGHHVDDSDLSVTVGGNVGYHTGFRDTFYNNGFGSLLVEPTWFSGKLSLRFPVTGGYGGRDQFSTLYHLMGGFLVGYRVNEWFDWGGGALASGLYGYTPIDGVGSYLEQYQVDGTFYVAFLLGDWLELKPYLGIGYSANQVFPDHNVSFGGGLMFGIPIGRD